MNLRSLSWADCPVHGRQLHGYSTCVSCAKEPPTYRPSVVSTPIEATFNNQTSIAARKRLKQAAARQRGTANAAHAARQARVGR